MKLSEELLIDLDRKLRIATAYLELYGEDLKKDENICLGRFIQENDQERESRIKTEQFVPGRKIERYLAVMYTSKDRLLLDEVSARWRKGDFKDDKRCSYKSCPCRGELVLKLERDVV